MALIWNRNATTTPTNNGTWGHWHPDQHVLIGQTAIRTYWSAELWTTYADVGSYPIGSSLIRAGLIMLPPGTQESDIPSPISQGNEDWMDIRSLHPRVQIAQAAGTAWQIEWPLYEQDVKSMRKARDLDLAPFVVWEMQVGPGAVSGFVVAGWWVSVDVLKKIPDTP